MNRQAKGQPPSDGLVDSGFFVLRTPLLPFAELEAWSGELRYPQSRAREGADLESAIESDRQMLRRRLRPLLDSDPVRQAVYIASPSLAESLSAWLESPDAGRGGKAESSLVSYLMRMAGRATPFGLFAGCSIGRIGARSQLALAPRSAYRSHTRLDMGYLTGLCDALAADPATRSALTYRPNPGLYRAGGHFRLAERRSTEPAGPYTYHLVSIEPTKALEDTLGRARDGARPGELADALCRDYDTVSVEEAEEFVADLIDGQVLLPELEPPVTGPDPLQDILRVIRETGESVGVVEKLEQAANALANIDAAGLGVPPERYRRVADDIGALTRGAGGRHLFHVDLYKPAPEATLGPAVIGEIRRGIALLQRLSPPQPRQDVIQFRDAFLERYQDREVPLAEALDEETGIGFGAPPPEEAEASPLLEGLALSGGGGQSVPWSDRETRLFRRLCRVLQSGVDELALEDDDIDALAAAESPPLPPALAANVTVAARSESAVDRGDFRLLWHGAFGPSGALYLGRFCHGSTELRRWVELHLAAEEALSPEAVFAEIVHLPPGRIGNVICRPAFRRYEIPYHGRSGVAPECQLPVGDLRVAVANGRIVLRSARLEREVVPRLSTAHNAPQAELGVYRFLCALQVQDVANWLAWDWGVLQTAPFLPRVRAGRLVLARARWRLDENDLAGLAHRRGAALMRAVDELRDRLRLPRWVVLTHADRLLPLDLDNVLCAELLASQARRASALDLKELYPTPDQLCVYGPEGRFVHEMLVPLVRSEAASAASATGAPARVPAGGARRVFPPGSEWLYAKLYVGAAGVERVLLEAVEPVVHRAATEGAVERWFFVRYADPHAQLRLRLSGDPGYLQTELWPMLMERLVPLMEDGTVWRVQLDTYDRELERYGGGAGIELAEALFHADSEAALGLLPFLQVEEAGLRWRIALLSAHRLMDDLGLELEPRIRQLTAMRDGLRKEFGADREVDRQVGRKFRDLRNEIESMLGATGTGDPGEALVAAASILDRRSERVRPIGRELTRLASTGELGRSVEELALSFVHMSTNRLLRAAARAQELVLYDLLVRHYQSIVARAGFR